MFVNWSKDFLHTLLYFTYSSYFLSQGFPSFVHALVLVQVCNIGTRIRTRTRTRTHFTLKYITYLKVPANHNNKMI